MCKGFEVHHGPTRLHVNQLLTTLLATDELTCSVSDEHLNVCLEQTRRIPIVGTGRVEVKFAGSGATMRTKNVRRDHSAPQRPIPGVRTDKNLNRQDGKFAPAIGSTTGTGTLLDLRAF